MFSRKRIYEALEAPSNPIERTISYVVLSLILISIVSLVIQERFPKFADSNSEWLIVLEWVVLIVFGTEYLTRAVVTPRLRDYVLDWNGAIDLIAVLPSFVGLLFPVVPNITWLRALRLFRLLRILKLVKEGRRTDGLWSGIFARLAPFIGLALAFKTVVLLFEQETWWINAKDLAAMLAVMGFVIGVLLATKLGSAQRRIYAVEDALTDIVGMLEGLRHNSSDESTLKKWAEELQCVLSSGDGLDRFRRTHTIMSRQLGKEMPAPFAVSLQQKTSFLLHRVETTTPKSYDQFLRNITILYTALVILVMPGLVGFFSAALVVYVLGGMYVIISDMDRPINHDREALIDADIEPLTLFISSWNLDETESGRVASQGGQ